MAIGTITSPYWALESTAFEQLKTTLAKGVSITAGTGRNTRAQSLADIYHHTAVIRIQGLLMKSDNDILRYFGGTSTTAIRHAVTDAAADSGVENILLVVDSPGGSVDGLAEAGDAIRAARDIKPVVAQVDGTAASAAYYLASQANEIHAGRMDLIGSIGVRMLLYDWSKAFANEGIEAVPIDTGEHKSAGAMGTKITQAQRDEFQRMVDEYFEDFVSAVVRGRGVSEATVRKSADGRAWTGTTAIARGLIDSLATLDQTLQRMIYRGGKKQESHALRAWKHQSRGWSLRGRTAGMSIGRGGCK